MRKSSISLQEWCMRNEKEFLLKEWDYSKNDFSPCEVSRASKKKAYWICFCCGSNYLMAIQNRTLNGSKCPKCSRKEAHEKERKRRIKETGSLAEKRPDILEKWDYEKNKKISPYEVSPKSTINVWWKCQICGYEFQSRVIDVKSSNGCVKCRGNKYVHIGKDGTYTIYCHTCPDGKKYIGMTSMRLCERFGKGRFYQETSRFGIAIKEFGWENIEHEVLESGLNFEEACDMEKHYIKLYKTTETDFGYNMAEGGNIKTVRGRKVSEETRKKISDSNTGVKRSNETKEKLRISHIGKKSHNVRAVIKMDLDGNELEEYESMMEASRKNNASEKCIQACCSGRRKTTGGYKWKYKD